MASTSASTANLRAKRWLFYIDNALPEVSQHLLNVGQQFGFIKFGFRQGKIEGLLLLHDRKRIGQVRQYIKNGAKVMTMTLSIQVHSMQLDILDNATESGNVSLSNMHDADSGFGAEIEFAKAY